VLPETFWLGKNVAVRQDQRQNYQRARQNKMTTLRDISRQLNLSVTQVSRALNGHSDVSIDTRERVMYAAKLLKYQPNLTARKLVMGKSGIVGLVLPKVPTILQDGLFVQIAGGLSSHFSRKGMQFVLHIADETDDIIDVYRRLIDSGSLDGFVVLEPVNGDPRVAYLRERKVPFVLHGRHEPTPDYPYFDIDNEAVGYRLTRLLLDQGHQQIAFLNGHAGRSYVEQRRTGYVRALTEAGQKPQPGLHMCDDMTEAFGLVGMVRLLDDKRHNPTGVICGNTLIAKGVLHILNTLKIDVPGQISVVAHDDELPHTHTASFNPPLTVTHAPLERSWQPLAELLTDAVDGVPVGQLQRYGDVALISRESVGPNPDKQNCN
jgi:LacI family transcriptional regulator